MDSLTAKLWEKPMELDGIAWDVYMLYGPSSDWGPELGARLLSVSRPTADAGQTYRPVKANSTSHRRVSGYHKWRHVLRRSLQSDRPSPVSRLFRRSRYPAD